MAALKTRGARPSTTQVLTLPVVEDSITSRAFDAVADFADRVWALVRLHIGAGGAVHAVVSSTAAGFAPASGGGTTNFLRADGAWAAPGGGGGGVSDGDKGDVVVSGSGAVWTIDADAVSNAKLADMPATTIKGNATGGAANPTDLTGTQTTAMLDVFTSALKGLAPASGGGTSKYLRADGTWTAPVPAWTSVEVDFGSTPTTAKTFTVVDASVGASSPVAVVQSGAAATGRNADEAEMDPIVASALPAAGSFTLIATAMQGPVVGKYKLIYQVGA